MSYNVNIAGFAELQVKVDKLPGRIQKEVDSVIEAGAKEFVKGAKRDAAKDFGFLTGGIGYEKTGINVRIFSLSAYSPYVEWGTITRVSVPELEKSYAIQFKGKGIRKTGGLYPRPFFFTQLPKTKAFIERGIKAIMRDEKL